MCLTGQTAKFWMQMWSLIYSLHETVLCQAKEGLQKAAGSDLLSLLVHAAETNEHVWVFLTFIVQYCCHSPPRNASGHFNIQLWLFAVCIYMFSVIHSWTMSWFWMNAWISYSQAMIQQVCVLFFVLEPYLTTLAFGWKLNNSMILNISSISKYAFLVDILHGYASRYIGQGLLMGYAYMVALFFLFLVCALISRFWPAICHWAVFLRMF